MVCMTIYYNIGVTTVGCPFIPQRAFVYYTINAHVRSAGMGRRLV